MSLKVTSKEKQSGVFVLYLIGSLDTNTYYTLENRVKLIFEGHPKLIIFDMEELEYISSMGVRVILQAQKEMKKRDGSIKMMNMKTQVQKVFEIIYSLPADQVFGSQEEMDSYLDKIQKKVMEE